MNPHDDASANDPQAGNNDTFALLNEADRRRIWERLAAQPAVIPRKPTPLTDFDLDFQALVPAKLEPVIRLGAAMVGWELESFSCAHQRVMRVARKYGAMHLSDAAFWALDQWIDQQLLACIDEPAPEGLISPDRLAAITGEPR